MGDDPDDDDEAAIDALFQSMDPQGVASGNGPVDIPAGGLRSGGVSTSDRQEEEPIGEVILDRQSATIARDTLALTAKWWELSRPRRRGKIKPQPPGSKKDFPGLFQEWLKLRGLTGALEQEEDQQGYSVFRFVRNELTPEQENWTQAFHGTRCYALWLITASGVMLESTDKDAGHDFWEPGIYCTPVLETARWYGRPHILFGDGVYHRAILELRVDVSRRKKERQRGGVQWVFPEDAVVIRAVWMQSNAPPDVDEQRFDEWDPELEAVPDGHRAPAAIINSRQGPWSDDEEDDYADCGYEGSFSASPPNYQRIATMAAAALGTVLRGGVPSCAPGLASMHEALAYVQQSSYAASGPAYQRLVPSQAPYHRRMNAALRPPHAAGRGSVGSVGSPEEDMLGGGGSSASYPRMRGSVMLRGPMPAARPKNVGTPPSMVGYPATTPKAKAAAKPQEVGIPDSLGPPVLADLPEMPEPPVVESPASVSTKEEPPKEPSADGLGSIFARMNFKKAKIATKADEPSTEKANAVEESSSKAEEHSTQLKAAEPKTDAVAKDKEAAAPSVEASKTCAKEVQSEEKSKTAAKKTASKLSANAAAKLVEDLTTDDVVMIQEGPEVLTVDDDEVPKGNPTVVKEPEKAAKKTELVNNGNKDANVQHQVDALPALQSPNVGSPSAPKTLPVLMTEATALLVATAKRSATKPGDLKLAPVSAKFGVVPPKAGHPALPPAVGAPQALVSPPAARTPWAPFPVGRVNGLAAPRPAVVHKAKEPAGALANGVVRAPLWTASTHQQTAASWSSAAEALKQGLVAAQAAAPAAAKEVQSQEQTFSWMKDGQETPPQLQSLSWLNQKTEKPQAQNPKLSWLQEDTQAHVSQQPQEALASNGCAGPPQSQCPQATPALDAPCFPAQQHQQQLQPALAQQMQQTQQPMQAQQLQQVQAPQVQHCQVQPVPQVQAVQQQIQQALLQHMQNPVALQLQQLQVQQAHAQQQQFQLLQAQQLQQQQQMQHMQAAAAGMVLPPVPALGCLQQGLPGMPVEDAASKRGRLEETETLESKKRRLLEEANMMLIAHGRTI